MSLGLYRYIEMLAFLVLIGNINIQRSVVPLRKQIVSARSWQDLIRSRQDCSNFQFQQDPGKILLKSLQEFF